MIKSICRHLTTTRCQVERRRWLIQWDQSRHPTNGPTSRAVVWPTEDHRHIWQIDQRALASSLIFQALPPLSLSSLSSSCLNCRLEAVPSWFAESPASWWQRRKCWRWWTSLYREAWSKPTCQWFSFFTDVIVIWILSRKLYFYIINSNF